VKTYLASLGQAGHLIAEVAMFNFHQEHQMRMRKCVDKCALIKWLEWRGRSDEQLD
jgi:hypothetical protein